MSDRIEIRALRVIATHGALPFEKERAQPFEVDIDLEVDLRKAGVSDRLDDTVNYGHVVRMVERIIREEQYELLERLAERISDELLSHALVQRVEVAIRKLRPPIPVDVETIGVKIVRP